MVVIADISTDSQHCLHNQLSGDFRVQHRVRLIIIGRGADAIQRSGVQVSKVRERIMTDEQRNM